MDRFIQKKNWLEREPFWKLFFIEKNCAHIKNQSGRTFFTERVWIGKQGEKGKNRKKEIKNHGFEISDIVVH